MTGLIATVIASLAGWLVEAPVRAVLGSGASLAASFVVGTAVFFVAKRFVADLRGDA